MALKTKFRSVYVPFSRKGFSCVGESMTKQSFKDECDINRILRRFETTGQLPDLIRSNPVYGDFSEPVDFQEACNTVLHAQTQFNALSSKVRERFGNDPAKFLEFVSDPKNYEEMRKLGLTKEIDSRPVSDENKGIPRGGNTSAPVKKGAEDKVVEPKGSATPQA